MVTFQRALVLLLARANAIVGESPLKTSVDVLGLLDTANDVSSTVDGFVCLFIEGISFNFEIIYLFGSSSQSIKNCIAILFFLRGPHPLLMRYCTWFAWC